MAINPNSNKLYVAVPVVDEIQVLNGSSDKIITNISVGADPNAVAVDSVKNRIYVTSPENDKLYIIDGFSDKVISEIQMGRSAADLAIDTGEFGGFASIVFVANSASDSISVLDSSTGRLVENITMTKGASPYTLAVNPVSNKLYVTTANNAITVIDYATTSNHTLESELSSTIPVGLFPQGIVVDHTTNKVYVSNTGENTVSVINGSTNKLEYNFLSECFHIRWLLIRLILRYMSLTMVTTPFPSYNSPKIIQRKRGKTMA